MVVAPSTQRINIALPEVILTEFREVVPARKRNQFIVNLVERELQRLRLMQAIEESAGAWSDEDHPELATAADIDQFVRNLRQTWLPRVGDSQSGDEPDSKGTENG